MNFKKSLSLLAIVLVCSLILYTYQKKQEQGSPPSQDKFERLKELVLDKPTKSPETVVKETKQTAILSETHQQFQALEAERQADYEERQAFLASLPEEPASEQVIGSRRMYMAHYSLRNPEIHDADSDTNKRVLEAMTRKALARRDSIRQAEAERN